MYTGQATNIACPGCQPGDGVRWHICGIGSLMQTTLQWCPSCHVHFLGTHQCERTVTAVSTAPPVVQTSSCTHCWCVEDRSRSRNVPGVGLSGTTIYVTKVHEVCCGCGSRRATAEDIAHLGRTDPCKRPPAHPV